MKKLVNILFSLVETVTSYGNKCLYVETEGKLILQRIAYFAFEINPKSRVFLKRIDHVNSSKNELTRPSRIHVTGLNEVQLNAIVSRPDVWGQWDEKKTKGKAKTTKPFIETAPMLQAKEAAKAAKANKAPAIDVNALLTKYAELAAQVEAMKAQVKPKRMVIKEA